MPIPYRELPPEAQKEIRRYYLEKAWSAAALALLVAGLGWLMIVKMIKGQEMALNDGLVPGGVFLFGLIVAYAQKGHHGAR